MEILGFLVRIAVMMLDPIGWALTITIVSLMWRHTANRWVIVTSTIISACLLEALLASLGGNRHSFGLVHLIIAQAIQAAIFVGVLELVLAAFRRRRT